MRSIISLNNKGKIMNITDRIKETIKEIAKEKNINGHDVTLHQIAVRLAKELNTIENKKTNNHERQN